MSPTQYKAALHAIGLTQSGFAVWCGHHPATGKLWARKGAPPRIAKWLNFMLAKELTPNQIDRAIEGEKPLHSVPEAAASASPQGSR